MRRLPPVTGLLAFAFASAAVHAADATGESAADAAGGGQITIIEAMERALEGNEDVGILGEKVKQASAVRVQVLSGLLPWVNASGHYGFEKEVKIVLGSSGETTTIQPATTWGYGGQISMAILDASLFPALAAAGKTKKATELLLVSGKESVLVATAQAYVTLLFAGEAVALREAELETREAHRDEVAARLQADEALALDLKRAELDVLDARAALASARVDRALALDALCALMGDDPATPWEPVDLAATFPPPPPAPLTETDLASGMESGLSGSPAIEAQDLFKSASKLHAVSGGLSFLPSISLGASWDKGPSSFRSPDGTSWAVTFNLSWTLFDGGLTVGKVMEGVSQAAEAVLETEKTTKAQKALVHAAWLRFNLALENRDTAAERLDVARETRSMAEERYAAGLATGLEVEDALDACASAAMGLAGEEMNLTLAWLDYLVASGQFTSFFEGLE